MVPVRYMKDSKAYLVHPLLMIHWRLHTLSFFPKKTLRGAQRDFIHEIFVGTGVCQNVTVFGASVKLAKVAVAS